MNGSNMALPTFLRKGLGLVVFAHLRCVRDEKVSALGRVRRRPQPTACGGSLSSGDKKAANSARGPAVYRSGLGPALVLECTAPAAGADAVAIAWRMRIAERRRDALNRCEKSMRENTIASWRERQDDQHCSSESVSAFLATLLSGYRGFGRPYFGWPENRLPSRRSFSACTAASGVAQVIFAFTLPVTSARALSAARHPWSWPYWPSAHFDYG